MPFLPLNISPLYCQGNYFQIQSGTTFWYLVPSLINNSSLRRSLIILQGFFFLAGGKNDLLGRRHEYFHKTISRGEGWLAREQNITIENLKKRHLLWLQRLSWYAFLEKRAQSCCTWRCFCFLSILGYFPANCNVLSGQVNRFFWVSRVFVFLWVRELHYIFWGVWPVTVSVLRQTKKLHLKVMKNAVGKVPVFSSPL